MPNTLGTQRVTVSISDATGSTSPHCYRPVGHDGPGTDTASKLAPPSTSVPVAAITTLNTESLAAPWWTHSTLPSLVFTANTDGRWPLGSSSYGGLKLYAAANATPAESTTTTVVGGQTLKIKTRGWKR